MRQTFRKRCGRWWGGRVGRGRGYPDIKLVPASPIVVKRRCRARGVLSAAPGPPVGAELATPEIGLLVQKSRFIMAAMHLRPATIEINKVATMA